VNRWHSGTEATILLEGLVIGFAMAVPVGPLGVMCIRKTLAEGRLRGIVIGLGAATGDLLYGSIAAFGLTFISDTIDGQRVWLRLVGGAILLFLGVRTYRAHPVDPTANAKRSGLWRSYLTTILLTFTNPITIFSFIAVFAALGIAQLGCCDLQEEPGPQWHAMGQPDCRYPDTGFRFPRLRKPFITPCSLCRHRSAIVRLCCHLPALKQ
jgi:hypothetical protein